MSPSKQGEVQPAPPVFDPLLANSLGFAPRSTFKKTNCLRSFVLPFPLRELRESKKQGERQRISDAATEPFFTSRSERTFVQIALEKVQPDPGFAICSSPTLGIEPRNQCRCTYKFIPGQNNVTFRIPSHPRSPFA
jgi:hypothetical protein